MAELSVYVLANLRGTLYTVVTNGLLRGMTEHRQGLTPGFTGRCRVRRLVYYEAADSPLSESSARSRSNAGVAPGRWSCAGEVELIEAMKPGRTDPAEGLLGEASL